MPDKGKCGSNEKDLNILLQALKGFLKTSHSVRKRNPVHLLEYVQHIHGVLLKERSLSGTVFTFPKYHIGILNDKNEFWKLEPDLIILCA